MALAVVSRGDLFPVGTVVQAFVAPKPTGPVSSGVSGGAPPGAVVSEATVDATGTLTIAGLAEGQQYVLAAEVGGAWRYLRVMPTSDGASKIVTEILGGTGAFEATALATEYVNRIPICLPVATTRWRLRIRNYSPTLELAGTAKIKLLAALLGTPKWNANRWTGALTAAPVALPGISGEPEIGAAAGDYVSPWINAAALQFQPNVARALSLAFNKLAGKCYFDPYGSLVWAGAGSAAAAAAAAAPGIGALAYNNLLDVRIEYECAASGLLVGLCIGDSITQGQANLEVEAKGFSDFGCFHYEAWPGALSLRKRHPIINAGVGAAKTDSFANLAAGVWARLNLASSLPDYCVIGLGINDIGAGRTAAEIEANLTALILQVQQTLGISSVYLATCTPLAYEAAQEAVRVAVNTWMRKIPAGVTGVVDFDKILSTEAEPSKMNVAWDGGNTSPTTGPHPWRAGYQKMALTATLP